MRIIKEVYNKDIMWFTPGVEVYKVDSEIYRLVEQP